MPYIAVTTSKALSDEQKDELKKTIGQKISLIPGKTEAALMVDISDNHTMYFAGALPTILPPMRSTRVSCTAAAFVS